MKKLIYVLIILIFSVTKNKANAETPLHGNLIAPEYVFLNADASQAISVGLADIVLWDLTTAKPTLRIDLGNIIKDYNPWDTKFKIKASPSPTFKELLLEIDIDGKLTAYIFNMTTGLTCEIWDKK